MTMEELLEELKKLDFNKVSGLGKKFYNLLIDAEFNMLESIVAIVLFNENFYIDCSKSLASSGETSEEEAAKKVESLVSIITTLVKNSRKDESKESTEEPSSKDQTVGELPPES